MRFKLPLSKQIDKSCATTWHGLPVLDVGSFTNTDIHPSSHEWFSIVSMPWSVAKSFNAMKQIFVSVVYGLGGGGGVAGHMNSGGAERERSGECVGLDASV